MSVPLVAHHRREGFAPGDGVRVLAQPRRDPGARASTILDARRGAAPFQTTETAHVPAAAL